MAEPTDLSRAQAEYGSAVSPYAALSNYLMQQPVYDRGPREAPATPTMRQLEGPTTDELLADQYSKIMAEQKAADEAASAARQTEIDNLQSLLREEISTSADAASSQRSDMTTALENRIKELQAGVDTETAALRQQGLDERSAISAEQQRISDMVQANMDQTAADLAAQEERVKAAQATAVGSLEDQQKSLVTDFQSRIEELNTTLNDTQKQISSDLDARDEALTGAQKSAQDALQATIGSVRDDLASTREELSAEDLSQGNLITNLEGRIGDLGSSLNKTTEQINTDLDARDAALTGAQKSAAEAVQQEIDSVKSDLATIQSDIETESAAQIQALRDERGTLIGNIEANVQNLKDSIAAKADPDDLQLQIEKLRGESENLKSTASEERKDLFLQMEALRDGALTNDQVNASIASALETGTLSPDQINSAIETLKGEVEGKIGGLASTESLNQLQSDIEGIGTALTGTIASSLDLSSKVDLLQKALEGRATNEDLAKLQESLQGNASGIEALQKALEGRATNEDLAILQESLAATASKDELAALQASLTGATGDFDTRFSELQKQMLNPDDIAKQRADAIAAAMDPIAAQRQEAIAAAMSPIAQQRQEAITGAINPIQAQIEELRGSIPAQQNIDIDALRKSIIDEINAKTPAVDTGGGSTGGGSTGGGSTGGGSTGGGFSGTPIDNFMGGNIPTGYIDVGPSASEAAGFNPAGGGSGGGGNQSIVDNSGYLDFYNQQTLNPVSPVKTGNMPGGGVGSGYVKTGAPAYSQSGPFQVTQAPALQAAPKFSYAGSRRRG
jgi:uncharacterized membrane protein YgcG